MNAIAAAGPQARDGSAAPIHIPAPRGLVPATQKLLGAFYTPYALAQELADWAIRSPKDTALDPSCGAGVFLEALTRRLETAGCLPSQSRRQVWGVDVDADAVKAAASRHPSDRLITADFFSIEPGRIPSVTACVGNPPYVRYQLAGASGERAAAVARELGVPLGRRASLWAPFLLHAARFVAPGGRFGQLVPSELLFADYARPLLHHLAGSFERLRIITFAERIFPGVQTQVLLVLGEGARAPGDRAPIEITQCSSLAELPKVMRQETAGHLDVEAPLLHLLPRTTQRLVRSAAACDGVTQLGQVAAVDIGVVTGANDFFVVDDAFVSRRIVPTDWLKPIVAGARGVRGARLSSQDIAEARSAGLKTWLLSIPSDVTLNGFLERYIEIGESEGLNARAKCKCRTPWYAVRTPGSREPDAFLTYTSDAFPRLVMNEIGAVSTNAVHHVFFANRRETARRVVSFYNSLTLLGAELAGRGYGGGTLKLEPTAAEHLHVPANPSGIGKHLKRIDRSLRAGRLDIVVREVDSLVLRPLGFSEKELRSLRKAREELHVRRKRASRMPKPRVIRVAPVQ